MYILKSAIVFFAAILMAQPVEAQRQWTVTGQEVPEFAAIDEMLRVQMLRHDISASSVAITKDGRLVYARGYTWDQADVEPVQPTSLFRTGSIAKSITSVAIHQLIEDGLLSYDTRVAETLGLEPPRGESADPWIELVTVDHLLTHTVGWDKYDGGIDPMVFRDLWVALSLGVMPPPTRHEIATFMTGEPFQFYPGSRWAYCNFGYLLLQMLAEQVTGVDFPEYVHDNIFRPVGVGRARMARTPRSDLAPTERYYVGDYEGDPYSLTWENAYAAGGMVLSAPDLARLYTALFDDPDASGLLREDSIDSMLSLPFAASVDRGYGRGWIFEEFYLQPDVDKDMGGFINLDDDLEVYSHGGGGPGVHALAMWRSDGFGFFWCSNKDPLVDDFDDFPEIHNWPQHDLWQSVGISREAVGSAPVESWIPAVAHTNGVGTSTWRTDVGLLNRSSSSNMVRLRYHHMWRDLDHEIDLAPGEFVVVEDVVGGFDREGSGPLQVFSSEGLTVTSRTFNQSEGGTFGQSMGGVTATGGLESGESAVLMQLQENDAARTNIGLHNQWRRSAEVEIALFDAGGSLISSHRRQIWPQQTLQLNRPFFNLGGREDVDSGYAVVTVVSGQDVYSYASVIDNITGDPSSVAMKTTGSGHQEQWIAAATHGEGAHGSQWRTDVCLLNLSEGPAEVEVVFHGAGSADGTAPVMLAAGEQRILRDVVAQVGSTGSGSIEVDSSEKLMVSSRTYNASDNGTFGLFLDGIASQSTADRGDTVWLPHLRQDERFRTNIGFVNTGDSNTRIRITLFDNFGADLDSRRRTLEPGAWLQLQEPYARLADRSDISAGYARIEVETGNGVVTYASVIDNATNDATAIAMRR